MKVRPVVAQLFHADKQTYRHDAANSCFFEILRTRIKTVNGRLFFKYPDVTNVENAVIYQKSHRLSCHLRIKTHKRGQSWTLPPQRADIDGAIPRVSIGIFLLVDIFSHQ